MIFSFYISVAHLQAFHNDDGDNEISMTSHANAVLQNQNEVSDTSHNWLRCRF